MPFGEVFIRPLGMLAHLIDCTDSAPIVALAGDEGSPIIVINI